jgi:hypothetical protein
MEILVLLLQREITITIAVLKRRDKLLHLKLYLFTLILYSNHLIIVVHVIG